MTNALTKNPSVLSWIEDKVALVQPDQIVWIDGSEDQLNALRAEACSTGEMLKLNEEKLPGCYLHRTDPDDVASVAEYLTGHGYELLSAQAEMVPQSYITLTDEGDIKNMQKMIDMFEDNDDVQNVWHNWDND